MKGRNLGARATDPKAAVISLKFESTVPQCTMRIEQVHRGKFKKQVIK
jgi:hypothetical protein